MIEPKLREKKKKRGCKYCGTFENLTIDHKIPKILGGKDEAKNLQCLCKHCNMRKSKMTQKELAGIFIWYESFRGKTKFTQKIIKQNE